MKRWRDGETERPRDRETERQRKLKKLCYSHLDRGKGHKPRNSALVKARKVKKEKKAFFP